MGKDLLDVAMKELVHSEKYKSMRIKGSQGHLYKRDGPYFWNAFYIEEGSPLNGTQKVRINISLKYWRFDELQWQIIHPWMEQKFTDKLRCNSGAMCRSHIETGAQFFTWEATEPVWKGKHEDLLILAESILEYILERVRSTIETAEKEFGSLGEYFIAHPEINPRLSGLSFIDKGDYQGAKEVFSSIETLNEGFYIRPETPEDLARMRSNAPEKDKEKMVFWRDYRDIYIDYCIAMLQGIPWTRDIVALGMPKKEAAMEKLYHIPEGAQDFMESPLIIRRGADVILRFDYEQEDGRYGYKGILFRNCTEATHRTESEIKYTDYRQAYNSVASDGGCFYIFFDGYGLYSFQAESFEQMANFASCEGDVPESFLHDIDRVYHLTELEYQQSDKRKTQLAQIMKELRSMRRALDRHVFAPYYPRVITDEWPRNDALGHELLQLARDYMNLR